MHAPFSPTYSIRLLLTLGTASAGLLLATPSWGQVSTTESISSLPPESTTAIASAPSSATTPASQAERTEEGVAIAPDQTVTDIGIPQDGLQPALQSPGNLTEAIPTEHPVSTLQAAPAVQEAIALTDDWAEQSSTQAQDLRAEPTDTAGLTRVDALAQVPPGARPPDPQRGFSARFGSALRPPTSLRGATRPRTVIPGNDRRTGFASINGHARWDISDNQYLLLEAIAGETILGADLSYTYLLDVPSRQGLSVNLFNQRSFHPAFTGGDPELDLPNGETPWVHRLGAGIEYFQPIAPNVNASIGVNYQRVSVREDLFGDEVFPFDEDGNALTFGDSGQDDLLTINLAAVYSTVDDPRRPTEGTRLRFGMDQAIPIGDAEIGFNRIAASATQFIPLDLFGFDEGPRTLVLNLQAGTMIGDVPPYEAFNLGGVNSVRGFSKGDVGTGSSFLQATAEYRFPITSFDVGPVDIPLVGLLFVDYGTDLGTADEVTGEPAEVRDRPGDGLGFGVGLRALTPFGTARLEFGLNDNGGSEVHFTLGERF